MTVPLLDECTAKTANLNLQIEADSTKWVIASAMSAMDRLDMGSSI
jgi:hypothetical protein